MVPTHSCTHARMHARTHVHTHTHKLLFLYTSEHTPAHFSGMCHALTPSPPCSFSSSLPPSLLPSFSLSLPACPPTLPCLGSSQVNVISPDRVVLSTSLSSTARVRGSQRGHAQWE